MEIPAYIFLIPKRIYMLALLPSSEVVMECALNMVSSIPYCIEDRKRCGMKGRNSQPHCDSIPRYFYRHPIPFTIPVG
jgi:hypothetical protein